MAFQNQKQLEATEAARGLPNRNPPAQQSGVSSAPAVAAAPAPAVEQVPQTGLLANGVASTTNGETRRAGPSPARWPSTSPCFRQDGQGQAQDGRATGGSGGSVPRSGAGAPRVAVPLFSLQELHSNVGVVQQKHVLGQQMLAS